MAKELKNIGASVRAQLLNIAKDRGQTFNFVLNRYAIERLLYRLSQSQHADRFVLKGATLLMRWFDEPFRGTQDLDLLGYGDPNPDAVLARSIAQAQSHADVKALHMTIGGQESSESMAGALEALGECDFAH